MGHSEDSSVTAVEIAAWIYAALGEPKDSHWGWKRGYSPVWGVGQNVVNAGIPLANLDENCVRALLEIEPDGQWTVTNAPFWAAVWRRFELLMHPK